MTNQSLYAEIYKQLESIGCVADNVVLTGRGNWKRLDSVAGKARNGHISYWLDSEGLGLFGFARNHHSGEEVGLFSSKNFDRLDKEGKASVRRQINEAKKRHKEEIKAAQDDAAEHAKAVWGACVDVGAVARFEEMTLLGYEERGAYLKDAIGDAGGYIAAKGIIPYGARFFKGGEIAGKKYSEMLVLPRYCGQNGIVSFQRIVSGSDGKHHKFYQEDGQADSAFYVVGKNLPEQPVVICEGWATACSIHEATGYYVLVAFDCNNLFKVVEYFKGKNPERDVIIAADSDQWRFKNGREPEIADEDGVLTKVRSSEVAGDDMSWEQWRQEGRLENIGLIKAHSAAKIFNCRVCEPGFDARDAAKKSDFNDLHLALGLDAVRERINDAKLVEESRELVPTGDIGYGLHFRPVEVLSERPDWESCLKRNEDGKIIRNSVHNQMLVMFNAPQVKGAYRFDEFFKKIMVMRDVTGRVPDDEWEVRKYDKTVDAQHIRIILESYGMQPPPVKSVACDVLLPVAMESPINMLKDKLESLTWDGVDRLDTWLINGMGAGVAGKDEDGCDPKYLAAIGRCWMMSAVARVYEPGCKFDHVLMTDGKQGGGKSTAFRVLSCLLDDSVDKDIYGKQGKLKLQTNMRLSDMESKDTLMKPQGKLIVLFDEIVGFAKRTDEEMKEWISNQTDEFRKPYAEDFDEFDRQFVIAGTTNKTEYLRDVQNRRYWVFSVIKEMKVEWIRDNRFHLWAEAVYRYKRGVNAKDEEEKKKYARYLSEDEYRLQEAEVAKRQESDLWDDAIEKAVEEMKHRPFKTHEVATALGLSMRDKDQRANQKIDRYLKIMGYDKKVVKVSGKSVRCWVRAEPEPDMSDF